MGKPSINGPFSMAMLNNQMVDVWRWFIQFSVLFRLFHRKYHLEHHYGIYIYIQILITVFIHISPGSSKIPIWSLSYSNIFIPISHHFPRTAGHPICARIGSPTGDGWAFWQSEAGCDEQGQQETWKTQEVSVNSKMNIFSTSLLIYIRHYFTILGI